VKRLLANRNLRLLSLGSVGILLLGMCGFVDLALADETQSGVVGHEGPILQVLLSLVVIIVAGRIGGDIALRLKQPEVLGELIIGVVLGNLALFGFHYFEYIKHDQTIAVLSELGVLLLLFQVGLETNIKEMLKVGPSSLIVAVLGVVAPFFLGWGVAAYFVPDGSTMLHAFIGATLCATSVGITARVLKDLGQIQRPEAKIILGAAVVDDVLGLLVLAIISAIIQAANKGSAIESFAILKIVFISVGFLFAAILIGGFLSPWIFRGARHLRSHGILLLMSLGICFGMSYLAGIAGLAPIVGAFTAGLVLDPVHYVDLKKRNRNATIEELLEPLSTFLVPIFFVLMGAKVDVSHFAHLDILGFALVLTVAAIVGKQICGLGVLEKGYDRWAVGLGMIPRGEVGLIFASIGLSLSLHGERIIDAGTYGAVVVMVMLTTMVTPPLIKWRFLRNMV